MMKRSRTVAFMVALTLVTTIAAPARADDGFAFYHENVLGTSLELKIQAKSREAARSAEDRVLREIDRLETILSGYDPSSEFRRWQDNSRGPTKVSAELFEVLAANDRWRVATRGAFDPRVETLSRLWSTSSKIGRTPSGAEIAKARELMARPSWRLDPVDQTAERLSDCPLSFNSIGKGYIIEKACAAGLAKSEGEQVLGLLLNLGGDIRIAGAIDTPVGIGSPWNASGTTEPLVFIAVKDQAIATSGRAHRGYRINGRWYSHIFDPRTALPADSTASATVIAPRNSDANALATTLNVLSPEEGLRLVRSLPGVECLIATADGRIVKSDGWERFETQRTEHVLAFAAKQQRPPSKKKGKANPTEKHAPTPDNKPPDSGLGKDHELEIDFEIAAPEGQTKGRYRRPYVAIWIEDEKERSVRTLELWLSMGGPGFERWLPDLKRWATSDLERAKIDKTDLAHTISQSTRQAGKYSIIWNGKDNNNEPMPEGEYTVNIEVAREHGTYQIIRKKVTLAGKPFTEELKGNVEVKSAAVEYRRRAPAKPKS